MLERAWKWSKSQCTIATSLGEAVSSRTRGEWQKLVDDYRADPSKPNPFAAPEISMFFFPVHAFP